jgi:hypothetical protein
VPSSVPLFFAPWFVLQSGVILTANRDVGPSFTRSWAGRHMPDKRAIVRFDPLGRERDRRQHGRNLERKRKVATRSTCHLVAKLTYHQTVVCHLV